MMKEMTGSLGQRSSDQCLHLYHAHPRGVLNFYTVRDPSRLNKVSLNMFYFCISIAFN